MNSAMLKLVYLVFVISATELTYAQPVSVLVKGGVSWYGVLHFSSFAGGSRGGEGWKPGPILGIGARLQTSKRISIEVDAEVSTFRHRTGFLGDPINDPQNTIWDLSFVSRFFANGDGEFDMCLLFGLGIAYQVEDDLIPSMPLYFGQIGVGRKAVGMTAVVGIAAEQPITERLSLTFEASLRFRNYGSTVVALSTIYTL